MEWLRRLFSRGPRERTGIPEVVGYVTDEHGQPQPLHRGPLQHHALTPDQMERIVRLREVLAEAYPMTLEGWTDGFLRDAHPESEIRIIEAVASVYQQLTTQARLSAEEKQIVYAVLCVASTGNRSPELAAKIPQGNGLPEFPVMVRMLDAALDADSRP